MAEKDKDQSETADEILGSYKQKMGECQQIATKINELQGERDEHKLVIESLTKLESERKAFRLIGGVLVERTVGEVLPDLSKNYDGLKELLGKLDETLKTKDKERLAYKEKHGIMTQEEREQMQKQNQKQIK